MVIIRKYLLVKETVDVITSNPPYIEGLSDAQRYPAIFVQPKLSLFSVGKMDYFNRGSLYK